MKDIYIVDAIAYLFRSYYAIRGMSTPSGEATNALFGFVRSMQKIITDFSPTHICAVFDGPNNKKSRTDLYADYKANRTGMPEDLVPQLGWAAQFCEYAGIPVLSIPGIEADDTIGSLTKWAKTHGCKVHICSGDKDLCQLVDPDVELIYTHKDNFRVDEKGVEELYGVKPTQIIDYLALCGDSSDNIPGLEGFGPKTVSALLQEHGTLEHLLDHPESVKGAKKQEVLRGGREIAMLSKQLATIDTGVDIPQKLSFYEKKPNDKKKLSELYNRLHFSSLLAELSASDAAEKAPAPKTHPASSLVVVQSIDALDTMLKSLEKASLICIDTETTGLDFFTAELVGIGLGAAEPKSDTIFYVPFNGGLSATLLKEKLAPFVASKHRSFLGHNLKYDMHILLQHGMPIAKIGFDTMLAAYLIAPENSRYSLDDVTLSYLGKHKIPISSLIGSGKNEISMKEVSIADVAVYCGEDVSCTIELYSLFSQKLEELSLKPSFENVELPLIPVLLSMERAGIFLDVSLLEEKSVTIKAALEKLSKEIYDAAGKPFNINSPKQLSEILFIDLGIKSPSKKLSTRADLLEQIRGEHPIIPALLTYRQLEKLRSTYIDALPGQIHPITGRIHCSFNQTGTATGRLSSTNPNLQNIPVRTSEGKAIREAFKPQKEGYSFFAADYSQIELRLLAHFSQETSLIKAFKEEKDIHASVAAEVFDVPLDMVTGAMRSQAKTVNFGILYGQGAFGLSQQLGIEQRKAKEFIERYFAKYPAIVAYIEECKEKAKLKGFAETLTGRRRPLPDINSKNGMLRSQSERLAVNTPLQGSQADIIKMAMIQLHKEKSIGSLILQIHDELIFELPDEAIPHAGKIIQSTMETVVSLDLPLKVNIAIGKNWGEC